MWGLTVSEVLSVTLMVRHGDMQTDIVLELRVLHFDWQQQDMS